MAVYIVRRLLVTIPLLIAASFLSFALMTRMGDPLAEWKMIKHRSDAEIAAAEQRIGLDKPFLQRYSDWAVNFVQGDWGTTVVPGNGTVDVRDKVMRSTWVTARLVLGSEIVALLLGVAVGVLGAIRQYSMADYTATAAAFVMLSTPVFCVAVLIKFAGIEFNDFLEAHGMGRWLVTAGPPDGGFHGSLADQLYQYSGVYLLPTICLALVQFGLYSRFQRSSMLEVMGSDYVRTATAKGLSRSRVLFRHVLRTALIPTTTLFALGFGATISGAVITETVFGWQGLGLLTVQSVNNREPFMVLGVMMVTAMFVLACNLVADIGYTILDPRIRLSP